MLRLAALLLLLWAPGLLSQSDFEFSVDQCYLTPDLGNIGTRKFLEECEEIGRFTKVPKPLTDSASSFGVHSVICCPDHFTDPADLELEEEYDPDYEYNSNYDFVKPTPPPMMSDEDCSLEAGTQCVPLSQCRSLDSSDPDLSYPCGFDTSISLLKVCCPPENITQPQIEAPKARFPKSGRARRVEDKSELCSKWRRNEACRLDKHFLISDEDEDNSFGEVFSRDMFDFMQRSCAKTCGWVESGCHDEHPRCEDWARRGMCVTSGMFMAHTCRESCGVCGFLAPENKEIQTRGGRSYTDFTISNFDCGRYKPLEEINDVTEETEENSVLSDSNDFSADLIEPKGANVEELEVFSLGLDGGEYFCGATIINDRWLLSAAHCYDDNKEEVQFFQPREIKVNTLRDGTTFKEVIEIKRVYQHPNYQYPKLYDDIAVVELGRIIPYDYEKYGDSPTCLDKNTNNDGYSGVTATVQGYGETEFGTSGTLLETNVTVISNQDCIEMLNHNTTFEASVRTQVTEQLPYGLNYGLFCAQGHQDETTEVFSGPCKGDCGGPMMTDDENNENRSTLIGIVSGGIGCGLGIPAWYTKVSFHIKWIRCIIYQSALFDNNQKKVVEACKNTVLPKPTCVEETDLVFGVEEFENIENNTHELCDGRNY